MPDAWEGKYAQKGNEKRSLGIPSKMGSKAEIHSPLRVSSKHIEMVNKNLHTSKLKHGVGNEYGAHSDNTEHGSR